MSTTTIPFVRSVIAASIAAGSRFSVRGSTSANIGTPPSKMKQFAVATKAIGDVITTRLDTGDVAEHVQSCRTARDSRRVGRADTLREELLEAVDRRPERQPPGAEHVD